MKEWVHGLRFDNVRGDIYGGITAAIVALPLALAFGVSSGAGPIAGLYGAIFVGFFAALFGGTPAQVSGPTGPMTVVMAATFTQYVAHDPQTGPMLAFTVVMMGGLFQILFGVLRLGRYISLVPFPVISGFMSGIGVIIVILQLAPLIGYATPKGGPLAAVQNFPEIITHPVPEALTLGLLSLAIVYFWPPRLNRVIPSQLLALIIGTMALLLVFPNGNATRLGEIPTGFPSLHMPVFELALFTDMVKSSLVLAALGAIDSLLTSLVADNKTRTHHESDRELIGQGIGNTISGLFGGLPGAGATMRTVVNIRAGGQTPISGVLHALILLGIVLGAGPLAEDIPHAVLAGILIKVGLDIIDWDFLKRLRTAPRVGVIMMFAVLFITVFVDLITAVAVGVIAACFIFVHRMSELQLANIKVFTEPDEEAPLDAEESKLMEQAGGRILLYHLSGPMSFGAAKGMTRRLSGIEEYEILLLDLSDVPMIDTTTCKAIEDIIHDNLDFGREVYVIGFDDRVFEVMDRLGTLSPLDRTHVVKTRIEALRHAALSLEAS